MPYIAKGEEIMSERTGYVGVARRDIPVTVIDCDSDPDGPDACTVRIKRREWVVWGGSLRFTDAEMRGFRAAEAAELAAMVGVTDDDDLPF